MSIPSHSFEIKLFGPFDARVNGVPIPPLRSRRGQWILALLALRLDREVERDWLAATVWPDSDPDQALPTLRRTLTDVRNALGEAASYLTSPTPHSLRLVADGVAVDVYAFDKLVAESSEESLRQAVDIFAPLLEDCGEEWAVQERAAKTEAYLSAIEKLAEGLGDRGQFSDAARYLRIAATTDPFRESVRQQLMCALSSGGSLSEALECYRDYRILLRRELNTEPGPATTDLYRALREGRQNPLRPTVHAVVSTNVKPAPSSAVRLPIPITPYIGREDDIEDLASMLATARLLTLTGPGGIGKTRLAIESARTSAAQFVDGVWFVDLSAIREGALIPGAVSNTLGIREQPGREHSTTLCEGLASKSLLLVLDNCEHQIESCAALAKKLLSECPGVHILATSRQRLGIGGEKNWQVPPLSMPPEGKLTNHMAAGAESLIGRYEAIRLFVERAQTAMPVFQMNEQTASEIVDVCRRLEGMPLALELAAARVRVLSISEISRRLSDRFKLLSRGDQASPQRQQTLRGAIDWSYDLLSEKERRFFARLAVFSGGWNLEAAEFVCADPEDRHKGIVSDEILDLLSDMVDKSLVSVEGGVEGVTRYRMMEAIREYATERLSGGEEEAETRARHKEFYISFAHRARQEVHGSDQTMWLARINQEYGNFRAVLSGSTDPETLYKMVAYLWQYWLVRGHYREGVHWIRLALREEGDEYYDYRIKALEGGAILSTEISDFESADCWFTENLALRRRFGNQAHISFALNNYALSLVYRNRHQEARPLLEESLVYKRKTNDRHGIAMSTGNLANILMATGDLEAAEPLFRESLELCVEAQDAHNICWSYGNLASLLGRTGREEEALRLYQECVRIAWGMVDVRNTGVVIARMGVLFYNLGQNVRGAQLVSLGYAMQLRSLNNSLLPADQIEMDGWIEMLRTGLGDMFDEAWNSGKLLDPDIEIATLVTSSVASIQNRELFVPQASP